MTKKLDGYKLQKSISKGPAAIVKRAKHLATNQPVAIKILALKGYFKQKDAQSAKNPDQIKILVDREIFLAKHLKHSNVLTCLETRMDDNYAFIVMEWMGGHSLLELIQASGGCLSESQARKYFRQLIHGISYCHNNMLVHRDIKPANLLLNKSLKNLKIIDFGLSNFPNEDLKLNTPCGTNPYQAPEISKVGDRKAYDSGVDIFSCGMTLYHLVFGNPVVANFREGRIVFTNKDKADKAELCNLITNMTMKDPKERITIPGIKSHGWFLGGDQEFLNEPHFEQHISNDILLETVALAKCSREDLIRGLLEGQNTELTTIYKLLERKKAEAEA